MGIINSSAGLLFKIDGDASNFEKEMKAVDASMTSVGGRMSSLAGIATMGAAALASLGVAAVASAAALFNLAKATSEYGSEIFDATEKTGLAAETISSIKVAADQSGASLEQVTGGISKFVKVIGEAEGGSDKAQEKLKKLGVTSMDLDTALGQALATIAKYPPGIQQMTAAQNAFGKSGADLLPFIKSFDGDLPGLIEKCKRLGLTMSDENARASDEFGDTLDQLSAQAAATGRTFAFEFMPDITRAMKDISEAFVANKDIIKDWAESFGNFLRGVMTGFREIISFYNNHPILARVLLGIATMGASESAIAITGAISSTGETGTLNGSMGGRVGAAANISTTSDADRTRSNAAAEKARRLAEEIARRDASAALSGEQNNLQGRRSEIGESVDELIRKVDEGRGSVAKFGNAMDIVFAQDDNGIDIVAKEFARLETNINNALDALEKLENQKRATNTAEENKLLTQNQILRRDQEMENLAQAREKFKQGVAEKDKERAEKAAQQIQDGIDKTKELMAVEAEREKQLASDQTAPGQAPPPGLQSPVASNPFKDTLDWLTDPGQGGAAMQMMDRFAQGIGNIVQNLVLMGTAGPNAMRKMTASVLASVAAQAAVQAVMFAAYGIAALTPWGAAIYGPALPWFKAAALMGSIALGTGLAGRAIAGNSFSQGGEGGAGGGLGMDESGNGNRPGLRFTEAFQGFEKTIDEKIGRVMEKTNAVLGRVGEQIDKFAEKFGGVSPGQVVMAGAEHASGAIFDAHLSEIRGDGGKATDVKRAMGDFNS